MTLNPVETLASEVERGTDMKKKTLTIAVAALMLAVSGCSESKTETESSDARFTPGTYTAEADGFGGTVSVSITAGENSIEKAEIIGKDETESVGQAAFETLTQQLIDAQSAEIDGVSGATFTSNAVKEAAQKAISQAEGTAEETASGTLTPGTYTAVKEGFQHGEVTVSVTVDETSIKDVSVTSITDHPVTVIRTPVEQIPAAIVENQSYNVDAVTGATLTSNAIKNAVKDCLEQAGGSEAFSKAPEHSAKTEKEAVETDVLVIGGGGSGMISAIEASIGDAADEKSGLKVTLIEKAGFLGGNTNVSGGVRYLYTDETGKYDEAWVEQSLQSEKETLSPYMELDFNEPLMRNEIQLMPHTNELLDDLGVVSADAWGYLAFASNDDHKEPKWDGSYLAYVLAPYLDESDIDVRLNTKACELLVNEDGEVTGAKVEDPEGTYEIHARKTILACGGFPYNHELIEKYAPEFTDGIVFAAGTNTGDGIQMAEQLGAEIIGDKMFGHLGADAIEGARPDYSLTFYYGYNSAMYVNMEGKRFVNEDKNSYVIYHDLLKEPEQTGWGIIDGNNKDASVLEESQSQYVHKADTVAELAEEIGVPADALQETIDNYNAMVNAGEDTDFHTAIDRMDVIDEGPYYAFILKPITFSSLVSVKVDGNGHVLKEDGEAIPNLFAAGDMVLGGNITSYYFDARGVGTAMYSGDLTGRTAKQELLSDAE